MKPSEYIEKGWVKFKLASKSTGAECPEYDSEAIAWCAFGAIKAAFPIKDNIKNPLLSNEARNFYTAVLKKIKFLDIVSWNNDPSISKADVLRVFKEVEEDLRII